MNGRRSGGSDVSVPLAVLEAVAERRGTDVTDLPPLADAVDPDALDALFAPTNTGARRDVGHVTFPYAGYTVVVHADGEIELGE